MSWKLATFGLVLGSALLALPLVVSGCAADTASDPADDEEAAASEADLTANAAKLVGAFHGDATKMAPTFQGIVFERSGAFLADVDTGLRCIKAPCPSNVRLTGKFTATKNYLRLIPAKGEAATSYHGRYRYTLQGDKLVLSRNDLASWTQSFAKEGSYCAAPSDCEVQGLIHPMCVGHWTCGTSAANACGYACGVAVDPIWPANATKLVASVSGGFLAPPPAGSTCQLSQHKYTLDVASKTLAWESCERTAAGPYAMVKGSKVISAADYAAVDAAMDALTIAKGDICGADKPFEKLEVTTPAGTKTFLDSFYSCQKNGTYVDGIGGVFAALADAKN